MKMNAAKTCQEKYKKEVCPIHFIRDVCISHVPCIRVNMIREKLVMELLEMILNTELSMQPTIAIIKQAWAGLVISSVLSPESINNSTRKEITRLNESVWFGRRSFLR